MGEGRELLLIVEDDDGVRRMLETVLHTDGRKVLSCATAAEARARLTTDRPQVVLLDLTLPETTAETASPEAGRAVLRDALGLSPRPMVIVLTGDERERSVVETIQAGAVEYLVKPVEPERLSADVARAFDQARRSRDAAVPADEAAPAEGWLVGRSRQMLEVKKLIGKLAASDVPVLVTGETGTGKELVARALHEYSPRKAGPFVVVDCASLPATLIESELFGYERGAFTGADRARPGKFEAADGGTLFLDEIGNVPPEIQSRLLRALQERVTVRLGSNQPVKWDARVVSATNTSLRAMVADGRFREDLLFRLAGAEIAVPPLRDRDGDVAVLAEHFLRRAAGGRGLTFSADALAAMKRHRWPGNVRELEHAVVRAAAVARTPVIAPEDLPEAVHGAAPLAAAGIDLPASRDGVLSLDEVRRRYARHVLGLCGNNRTEAARLLDIDRGTLATLLKEGDDE